MYGDIDSTSTSTEKSEIGKWKFNTNIPSSLSKINQNENKNYNDGKNIFKKDATVACYSKSKSNKSFDETCSLLTVKDNNNTGNHGNSFNSLYNPEQFIQALQTIVFTTDELLKTFCKCSSSNKYNKKRIKIFHSENLNVSSSTPTERIQSILKLKHKLNGMTNSSSKKQNRKRKKETITKPQAAHNLVRQESKITMNTSSLKQDIYSIPSVRSNYIRIRHKTNYSGKLRNPSSLVWQPSNVPYKDRIPICPPPPTYPPLSRKILPPACFISSQNPAQPVFSGSLPYSAALDYTKFQPTIICPPTTVTNTVSKKVCPKVVRPPLLVQPPLKGCIFHSKYPPILIIPPPPTTSQLFYPLCKISNKHKRSSFDGWPSKSRPFSSNSSLKMNAKKKRIRQNMKFISCSYTYSQRKISSTDEIPPICSHPEPIRPQLAPICPKRQKITKTKKSSISPQSFDNKYCKCISKATTSIFTSPLIEQKSSPTTNDGEQYKCISDSKNKIDKISISGTCENISIFDKNMCKCSEEDTSSLLTPSLSRKSSSVFDDYQCKCIDNFTNSISSVPQQITVSCESPSTYNHFQCECRYGSTSSIYSTTKYASNLQNSIPIKSELSKEIQADDVPPICSHPEPIRPQPAPICSEGPKITKTKKSSISPQSFDNKYCKCISKATTSIFTSPLIEQKSSPTTNDGEQYKCISDSKNKIDKISISGTCENISIFDKNMCKCSEEDTSSLLTPSLSRKSSSVFDDYQCKCIDNFTSSISSVPQQITVSCESPSTYNHFQCECRYGSTSSIYSTTKYASNLQNSIPIKSELSKEIQADDVPPICSHPEPIRPQPAPICSERPKITETKKSSISTQSFDNKYCKCISLPSSSIVSSDSIKTKSSSNIYDREQCKCNSASTTSIISLSSIKKMSSPSSYDPGRCKSISGSKLCMTTSPSIEKNLSPSSYDAEQCKCISKSTTSIFTSPLIEQKSSPTTNDGEQYKCISDSKNKIDKISISGTRENISIFDKNMCKCSEEDTSSLLTPSLSRKSSSVFDDYQCKCIDNFTSSISSVPQQITVSCESPSTYNHFQCECRYGSTSSIYSTTKYASNLQNSIPIKSELSKEIQADDVPPICSHPEPIRPQPAPICSERPKITKTKKSSISTQSFDNKYCKCISKATTGIFTSPLIEQKSSPTTNDGEQYKCISDSKNKIDKISISGTCENISIFDKNMCKCSEEDTSSLLTPSLSRKSSSVFDDYQCKCIDNFTSSISSVPQQITVSCESPSTYNHFQCECRYGSTSSIYSTTKYASNLQNSIPIKSELSKEIQADDVPPICSHPEPIRPQPAPICSERPKITKTKKSSISPQSFDNKYCKCISKATTSIFTSPLIEQKSSPTTNDGEQYKCISDSKNKIDKISISGTCENISIFDKNMCKCSEEDTSSLLTPSLSRKSSSVFDDYQCKCIDNFTSSISSVPQQITVSCESPSTYNHFQCECRYGSTSSIYSTTKYASNPQNSIPIKSELSKEIQADDVPPICSHPEPIRPQPAPICSERPKITETKKSSISTQSFDNKYCKCISLPSSSIVSSDSIKTKSSSNIYDREQCKCNSASTTSIISLSSIKKMSSPSSYDPGRCKSISGSKLCMTTSLSIEKNLSPSSYDAEQCKCISKSTTSIFTSPLIEQKSSPTTNDGEQYKCISDSKNKIDKISISGTCENISIFDKNMCKCSEEDTSSLLTPSLSRKSSSVFDDYQCKCIDNFTSSISSVPQQITVSCESPSTYNNFQCECRYGSTSSIYSTTKYASNLQNSIPIKSELSKEIQADDVPPICSHPEPIRPQPAPNCSEGPKITKTKKSSISPQSFDNKYCKCISKATTSIFTSPLIEQKSSPTTNDGEQYKCISDSKNKIDKILISGTCENISIFDKNMCKCSEEDTSSLLTPSLSRKSSSVFDDYQCKCIDNFTSSISSVPQQITVSCESPSTYNHFQCECRCGSTSSIYSTTKYASNLQNSIPIKSELSKEIQADDVPPICSHPEPIRPQPAPICSERPKITETKKSSISTQSFDNKYCKCISLPSSSIVSSDSIKTKSSSNIYDREQCKCNSASTTSIISLSSIKKMSSPSSYDPGRCKSISGSKLCMTTSPSIEKNLSPSSYDAEQCKCISKSTTSIFTSPLIEQKSSPTTNDGEQYKCISDSKNKIDKILISGTCENISIFDKNMCKCSEEDTSSLLTPSLSRKSSSVFDDYQCKCIDNFTSSISSVPQQITVSCESPSTYNNFQCECRYGSTSSIYSTTKYASNLQNSIPIKSELSKEIQADDVPPICSHPEPIRPQPAPICFERPNITETKKSSITQSFDNKYCKCISLQSSSIVSSDSIKTKSSSNIYDREQCKCNSASTTSIISLSSIKKKSSPSSYDPGRCKCISGSTTCMTTSPSVEKKLSPSTYDAEQCKCISKSTTSIFTSPLIEQKSSPSTFDREQCKCISDSTSCITAPSFKTSTTPEKFETTECTCSTLPSDSYKSSVTTKHTICSVCEIIGNECQCLTDTTYSKNCKNKTCTPSKYNTDKCCCSTIFTRCKTSSVVLTTNTASPCEQTQEECECKTDISISTICESKKVCTPRSYISRECWCCTRPTSEDTSKVPYESTSECIETPVNCICESEWTKSSPCLGKDTTTPSTYNIDECYCSTLPTKSQSSSVVLTKYTTSPCELTPEECRCLTDSTITTVCASHISPTPSSYISKECFCSTMPKSEDISENPLESTSECNETPVGCICVSDWTKSSSCVTRPSRTPSKFNTDECYCSTLPTKSQSSSVVLTKYTTSPCELTPEECRCLTDSTITAVCESHKSPTPSSYLSKECFCSTMPTSEDISRDPLESTSECIETPLDCICLTDWTKSSSCLTRASRTPSTYNIDECNCSTLPTKSQSSSVVLTKYTTSPCELTPDECRCLTDSTITTICASHISPTPSSYLSKECFCSTIPTSEDISGDPLESTSECIETPVDCICVSDWTKSSSCVTRPSRTPSKFNTDECYCSTLPTKSQSSSVVLTKYTTSPCELTPEECRCLTDSTITTVCASHISPTPSSYVSKECFCSSKPTSEDISRDPLESTSECIETPVDCICVSDWTKSSSCVTRPSRTPSKFKTDECYCSSLPTKSKSSVVLTKYTTSPCELTPEECRCLTDSTITTVCASHISPTPSSYISKECFCSSKPTSEDISRDPLESTTECTETPVDCICLTDWTKSSSCLTRPSRTPSTHNIDECYCSTLPTKSQSSSVVLTKYTSSPCELTPEECRCLTDSTITTVCASHISPTPSSYISKECFCSSMPTSEDISGDPLESTSECIETPVDCICLTDWTKSSSCLTRLSRTPSKFNTDECHCSSLPTKSQSSSVVLTKYTTSPCELTPEECRCLTDSTITTVCASHISPTPSSYISKECFCSSMPTSEDISRDPLESTTECTETPVDCICLTDWTKSSSCLTIPSRTPSTHNIDECYCSTLPTKSQSSSVVLTKYTSSPCELTPEECRCLTDSTITTVCASHISPTPSSYISKECFCSSMPTSEDISGDPLESTSECIETPLDCICLTDWTKSSSCLTRPSRTPSKFNTDECHCSTLPTKSQSSSVVLTKYTTSPCELTPEECRCLTDSTITAVCESHKSPTPSSYLSKECFCSTMPTSEDISRDPLESTSECIETPLDCICLTDWTKSSSCLTRASRTPSTYNIDECNCSTLPTKSQSSSVVLTKYTTSPCELTPEDCRCLTDSTLATDCVSHKSPTPSSYLSKKCFCSTIPTSEDISIATLESTSECIDTPVDCTCLTDWTKSSSCLTRPPRTPSTYNIDECNCSTIPTKSQSSSVVSNKDTTSPCELTPEECRCLTDSTITAVCESHKSPTPSSYLSKECFCSTMPTFEDISRDPLESTSECFETPVDCICLTDWTKSSSCLTRASRTPSTYNIDECNCSTLPTKSQSSSVVSNKDTTSPCELTPEECRCLTDSTLATDFVSHKSPTPSSYLSKECFCSTIPTSEDISIATLESTSECIETPVDCKCLTDWTKSSSCLTRPSRTPSTYNIDECNCSTLPTKSQSSSVVSNKDTTSPCELTPEECRCLTDSTLATDFVSHKSPTPSSYLSKECFCSTIPTSEDISIATLESTSECIETPVDCKCLTDWTKSSSCLTRPSRTPSTYNIDECNCSTLPTKSQSSSVVSTKDTTSSCELTPEECRCLTDATITTDCVSHKSPTPSSYLSKECFCSTMPTSEDISIATLESTSECIETPVDCTCLTDWTKSSSCLTRASRTPSTYNIDECNCSTLPTKSQSSSVVLTKYTTSPCELTPEECRCLTDSTLATDCVSHKSPTPSSYLSKECFCSTIPTSEDISIATLESTSECIETPLDCICLTDWTKSSSCLTRPSRTLSVYNTDKCYCSTLLTKPQSSSVVSTKDTTSPCELTPEECRCLTDATITTDCASHKSPTPSSYLSKECFCSTMPTSEDISRDPLESTSECIETPLDCICMSDWTKSSSCLTRPSRTPSVYNTDKCYCSTLLTKPQSSSVVSTKDTTSPCELTPEECRCLTDATITTDCASHKSPTPSSCIPKECFCSTVPTSEDISKGRLESTSECIETPVDCICLTDWTKSSSCLTRPSRTPSTYNIDECNCSTLPTMSQSSSVVSTKDTTSPCELTPEECRCLTDSTFPRVCESHESPTPSSYISKECRCNTISKSEDLSTAPYVSTSECIESLAECMCKSESSMPLDCRTKTSESPSYMNNECHCSIVPSISFGNSKDSISSVSKCLSTLYNECICLTEQSSLIDCTGEKRTSPSEYETKTCICKTLFTTFASSIFTFDFDSIMCSYSYPNECECTTEPISSKSCLSPKLETPSQYEKQECSCWFSRQGTSSHTFSTSPGSTCEINLYNCQCQSDSTTSESCNVSICTCKTEPTTTLKSTSKETVEDGECKCKSETLSVTTKTNYIISSDTFDYGTKCSCKTEPTTTLKSTSKETVEDEECKCKSETLSVTTKTNSIISSDTFDYGTKCSCKTEPTTTLKSTSKETVEDGECKCKSEILSVTTKTNSIISSETVDFGTKCSCKTEPTTTLKSTSKETVEDEECKCKSEILSVTTKTNSIISSETVDFGTKCSCKTEPTTTLKSTSKETVEDEECKCKSEILSVTTKTNSIISSETVDFGTKCSCKTEPTTTLKSTSKETVEDEECKCKSEILSVTTKTNSIISSETVDFGTKCSCKTEPTTTLKSTSKETVEDEECKCKSETLSVTTKTNSIISSETVDFGTKCSCKTEPTTTLKSTKKGTYSAVPRTDATTILDSKITIEDDERKCHSEIGSIDARTSSNSKSETFNYTAACPSEAANYDIFKVIYDSCKIDSTASKYSEDSKFISEICSQSKNYLCYKNLTGLKKLLHISLHDYSKTSFNKSQNKSSKVHDIVSNKSFTNVISNTSFRTKNVRKLKRKISLIHHDETFKSKSNNRIKNNEDFKQKSYEISKHKLSIINPVYLSSKKSRLTYLKKNENLSKNETKNLKSIVIVDKEKKSLRDFPKINLSKESVDGLIESKSISQKAKLEFIKQKSNIKSESDTSTNSKIFRRGDKFKKLNKFNRINSFHKIDIKKNISKLNNTTIKGTMSTDSEYFDVINTTNFNSEASDEDNDGSKKNLNSDNLKNSSNKDKSLLQQYEDWKKNSSACKELQKINEQLKNDNSNKNEIISIAKEGDNIKEKINSHQNEDNDNLEELLDEIFCDLKRMTTSLKQEALNIYCGVPKKIPEKQSANNFNNNNLKCLLNDSTKIKPAVCPCENSYPVSIKSVTPLGKCSFFITWKIHSLEGVKGYEIYIDGCLKNRLHSTSYESAVICGVSVNKRHVITLQAIGETLLELFEKNMRKKRECKTKDNWNLCPSICSKILKMAQYSLVPEKRQWNPSIFIYIPGKGSNNEVIPSTSTNN